MWTDRVLIIPRGVANTYPCGSTPLLSSIVLPRLPIGDLPSNHKSDNASMRTQYNSGKFT